MLRLEKKILIIIIAMLLTLVPSVYAENEKGPILVDIQTAQFVGENFIHGADFEEWKQSKLSYSETFYDLDESILGYYFLVTKEKNIKGHVIVSATEDRGLILQFGLEPLTLQKKDAEKGYYLGLQVAY